MSGKYEPVEAYCPNCKRTKIFYLGREPVPRCDKCGQVMDIREILIEGKRD